MDCGSHSKVLPSGVGSERQRSWVYDLIRRTRLLKRLGAPLAWLW